MYYWESGLAHHECEGSGKLQPVGSRSGTGRVTGQERAGRGGPGWEEGGTRSTRSNRGRGSGDGPDVATSLAGHV